MSIKDVMKLGTKGMNAAERAAELERRLKVVDRINTLGGKIKLADGKKKREYTRQFNRIKGEESCWLKSAGWFLYC